MYYCVAIGLLTCILLLAYRGLRHQKLYDSALKRRAVMNSHEQVLFSHLKLVFPDWHILTQVSFDTLLTTKFLRTRRKYQLMIADFVLLDENYQVLLVITFSESHHTRRASVQAYQDQLLELAGYHVIRFAHIPSLDELRQHLARDKVIRHSWLASHIAGEDKSLFNLNAIK